MVNLLLVLKRAFFLLGFWYSPTKFFISNIWEIILGLFLSLWLHSAWLILSRSIQVEEKCMASLCLKYHSALIQSSILGHLICFQIFIFGNRAVMSSVAICTFGTLGKELLNSIEVQFLVLKNDYIFHFLLNQLTFPPAVNEVPFLPASSLILVGICYCCCS